MGGDKVGVADEEFVLLVHVERDGKWSRSFHKVLCV